MSSKQPYQIAVVGCGSGGKDAALLAARAGLRTVVIEARPELGGTGFHQGCHAMRALRACATQYDRLVRSDRHGIYLRLAGAEWGNWLNVQRRTSDRLTEELGRELGRAKAEVKFGRAEFLNPNELLLTQPDGATEQIAANHIILATGSRPSYHGQDQTDTLNTDQILRSPRRPEHLLVVGGGYIGCEFAAIYRTLGSRVTLVEAAPRLLPSWDDEAGLNVQKILENQGVEVLLNQKIELPSPTVAGPTYFRLNNGMVITPDLTLMATGRSPNVENLGLEKIGLPSTTYLPVDAQMRTAVSSVFAVGDVTGFGLLDSIAAAQSRLVIQTILGFSVSFNPHAIPRCLHTDPPIAAVGLTESEARATYQNVEVLLETLPLVTDDDATVVEPDPTKVKIILQSTTSQLLGCLAIGSRATELVNLASACFSGGFTVQRFSNLPFVHPSAAEALVRMLQGRYDCDYQLRPLS